MKRNRSDYFLFLIIAVLAGLATRRFPHLFPQWVQLYAGDSIWAFMVFLLVGFLFPERKSKWVAIVALIFSFAIEISQLYHDPWIESLRAQRLGGLVLGFGFRWSDLVCYTTGVGLGYVMEKLLFFIGERRRRTEKARGKKIKDLELRSGPDSRNGLHSNRFGNESTPCTNPTAEGRCAKARGRATKERHPGLTNPD